MHQFYFSGIYSDRYNQYTLAYLLVIESILEKRYKWKRIDQNIHYCQIECYHIYIRRQRWDSNILLSIFMDSKMNDLMRHRHGPKSTHYIVNDSSHMTDYMINFEFNGLKKFIKAFFYEEKHKKPMKVLRLEQLAECRMLVTFLLKRIDLIVDLQLETEEMREHPEKYEPKQQ